MHQFLKTMLFLILSNCVFISFAQDWKHYGGDQGNTRYSENSNITPYNVSKLGLKWALQLGNVRAQESTPIVIGDTLYITSPGGPENIFAVNAKTGVIKWVHSPDLPKDYVQYACCDVGNKGAAFSNGKIFVARQDAKILALDAATGKELWTTAVRDYKDGVVINSAPLVVKNMVLTGYGGGEFGVRGAVVALDQVTGKEVWRTHTVPIGNEKYADTWKGDSGKNGGATVWGIGSYDEKLNLVYYGTGNPAPWFAAARGNDSSDIGKFSNLYSDSVIALNPETGNIVWHYQFTPHDAWDYDGVNELVFADLKIDGKPVPTIMQANRNGFFYVLNRSTGELISAKQYIEGVNWATGIDMKTGRPIETAGNAKRPGLDRWAKDICPNLIGAKNWMPMSFNPKTGLVYIPTQNLCMDMQGVQEEYKRGQFYLGVNFDLSKFGPGGHGGGLKAWDPVQQKQVWFNKVPLPWNGGTATTAGGLVFWGDVYGFFRAYDAKNGAMLWEMNTGSGIQAAPISYTIDGKQYIAVLSGRNRSIPAFMGEIGAKMIAASPEGGTLFVFSLN